MKQILTLHKTRLSPVEFFVIIMFLSTLGISGQRWDNVKVDYGIKIFQEKLSLKFYRPKFKYEKKTYWAENCINRQLLKKSSPNLTSTLKSDDFESRQICLIFTLWIIGDTISTWWSQKLISVVFKQSEVSKIPFTFPHPVDKG